MKNHKLLWTLIALLAATSVAEGVYIIARAKTDKPPPDAAADPWRDARGGLPRGAPMPLSRFDELFNDEFFGRPEPFAEIEGFNDWFKQRMEVDVLRPEIKTTDKEVVLSVEVPGLRGESMNVDVNDNRIRMSYDARTVESKTERGARVTSETERHFEKILPIPEGADPKKSRVVRDGNRVKIIFEKLRV